MATEYKLSYTASEINSKLSKIDEIDNLTTYVTPQMYGAIGDGVTDDTEAFERMFEYVENKVICLSQHYFLRNEITVTGKNVLIVGNGSVILNKGFRFVNCDITIRDLYFKDILYNAIVVENGKILIDNCYFNDIGIAEDLNHTSQGCGIYANTDFYIRIKNSYFENCYGDGAVFCWRDGCVDINLSKFVKNHYRAISIVGNSDNISKGFISNNYISECGEPNTSGSGVGCNGIYSTTGYGIIVKNNIILNSRENGIEGVFLEVSGNYIDGTGVEIDTKPTQSTEGIYIPCKTDTAVYDNVVKNTNGEGILAYTEDETNNKIVINNNIIYNTGKSSIRVHSLIKIDNVEVMNNIVDNNIEFHNPSDNVFYIGEVSRLIGSPNLVKNSPTFNFYHYFSEMGDFEHNNCTPQIIVEESESYVSVAYQQYAKLMYNIQKLIPKTNYLSCAIVGKGAFRVTMYKNGSYNSTLMECISEDFIETKKAIKLTPEEMDVYKLYIEFLSISDTSCIKSVGIKIYE